VACRETALTRLVAEAIGCLLDDARRSAARWLTGSSGPGCVTLKKLRPGSSGASEVRLLFIVGPARTAVLLVAGDKSGRLR